ncbi:hypothetical protein MMC28_007298 [Mycoblastus sanguinarius]|nr:hypothetical protein [Mycoblastus sanguinarius]
MAEAYTIFALVFCTINIVLSLTSIVLFAQRKLQPIAFLIFEAVKTASWLVVFVACVTYAQSNPVTENTSQGAKKTTLTSGIVTIVIELLLFIGSLIYASIIFHRHRQTRAEALLAYKTTQDRYYNGPYSGSGITATDYVRLNSLQDVRSEGRSPNLYTNEGAIAGESPVPMMGLFESDSKAIQDQITELATPQMSETAKEMQVDSHVYELGPSRSVKRERDAKFGLDMPSDLEAESPR